MIYRTFYMDESDANQWTKEAQHEQWAIEDQDTDITYEDIYKSGWYVWTMEKMNKNDTVYHDPEDGPYDSYLYQSLDGPFDTEEIAIQTICTNQFAEIQLHDE